MIELSAGCIRMKRGKEGGEGEGRGGSVEGKSDGGKNGCRMLVEYV